MGGDAAAAEAKRLIDEANNALAPWQGLVNICKNWRYSPLRAKHDRFTIFGFLKLRR
jgi:hypothetical protein